MIILWVDNFSRGGLEKSINFLVGELCRVKNPVTIFSLHGSRPFFKNYSNLASHAVNIVFFNSYLDAYINLLRHLRLGNTVISLKNHIPLIAASYLFRCSHGLCIRHSNSLISGFRKPLLHRNTFFNLNLTFMGFMIRCLIYRLAPYHVANSLENSLLVESFTGRRCFTFFTLERRSSESIPLIPKTIAGHKRVLWTGRYCASKGVAQLPFILHHFISESKTRFPNLTVEFSVYTNNVKQMSELFSREFPSFNRHIHIKPWANNIRHDDYDAVLFTSLHEGLSNAFLEALLSQVPVVVPVTSSGFLEFVHSRSGIYAYSPLSLSSFSSSLSSALALSVLPDYQSSPSDMPNDQLIARLNQQFLEWICT